MILTYIWIAVTAIGFFYKSWNAYDAYFDWQYAKNSGGQVELVERFAKDSFIASGVRAVVVGFFLVSGFLALALDLPKTSTWSIYNIRTVVMILAVGLLAFNAYWSRRERKAIMGDSIYDTASVGWVEGTQRDHARKPKNAKPAS